MPRGCGGASSCGMNERSRGARSGSASPGASGETTHCRPVAAPLGCAPARISCRKAATDFRSKTSGSRHQPCSRNCCISAALCSTLYGSCTKRSAERRGVVAGAGPAGSSAGAAISRGQPPGGHSLPCAVDALISAVVAVAARARPVESTALRLGAWLGRPWVPFPCQGRQVHAANTKQPGGQAGQGWASFQREDFLGLRTVPLLARGFGRRYRPGPFEHMRS